ncbi:MAG TPA: hypothetical protein VK669_02645, partial [Candidatus Limnocylindrales bacterium]|nr:hypothetical protein [Candidatus Limnocylindrales bacterium]
GELKHLVLHNLGLAALVEFLSELYTFPLIAELFFVPFMAILVGMQAVGEIQARVDARMIRAQRFINGCISMIGLGIILFVFVQTALHFGDTISRGKVKEFFLPLILMVAFVPLLYAWWYIMALQTALHMTKFSMRGTPGLFHFARFQIIKAVGFSLRRAELFESKYRGRLWGASTRAEVLSVLEDFRSASAQKADGPPEQ